MKAFRFALYNFFNYVLQKAAYRLDRPFAKPTQIVFFITSKCCFRCQMCDGWRLDYDDLPTADWKRIILDLKSWIGRDFYIHFSGGEPFLREDMVDILRFTSGQGIKTFVNSNGYVIDENLATGIAESGLDYLAISLDGILPETHDFIRGVEGAHEKTLQAIEHINSVKPRGMLAGISVAVMQANLDELVPLVEFTEERKLDRIGFHALRGKYRFAQKETGKAQEERQWYKHSPLWITNLKRLDAVIEQLIKLKRKGSPISNSISHLNAMKQYYRDPDKYRGPFRCMVGVNNFVVESDGTVKLCHRMEPLGDLKEQSAKEIWSSEHAANQRSMIKGCVKQCMTKALYTRSLREKAEQFFFLLKKGGLS
ncbi:radical SAM/SPASM domain-containing protein [Acidobacteriota bacterium]